MKKPIFVLIIALIVLFGANPSLAGFGIAPPYFQNSNLTRGSHYEQQIYLVRSEPVEDLSTEISIGVPGANEWISVDKGASFIWPKGEKQMPIIVSADVPKNAEFKTYPGYIRVKVIPTGPSAGGGQVAIILGGQIDVSLDVKDIKILDFKVWKVSALDTEEGHKVLWWFSPGKIKFGMEIENTGNVEGAPTKVQADIYDPFDQNLLESVQTTKIEKIKPFTTETVIAELLTKLKPGGYHLHFKIFKNEEIVRSGILSLSILPRGTLRPIPKEWYGLEVWIWLVAIGIMAVVVGGGGYLVWRKKRRKG